MFPLKEKDLINILADNVLQVMNRKERTFKRILIDSRHIKKNALFVALKGEKYDGHDFIAGCLKEKAGAIVSEKKPGEKILSLVKKSGALFVQVRSSLNALSALGAYNRQKSSARIIAITGSNGKTTTKEFLFQILKNKYKTVASEKSFNNHIGVPLTLLKIGPDTDFAVVEMGMNHKGELGRLTDMVLPDVALITNIAESHMEFFKDLSEVAMAKSEIFSGVKRGGYGVIPRDSIFYDLLKKYSPGKTYSFGEHRLSHYCIKECKITQRGFDFLMVCKGKTMRFHLLLPGVHNVANAAAAIAVCIEEGLSVPFIRSAVSKCRLPGMRMEIKKTKKGFSIINDAYNANPFSTHKALETFSRMFFKGKRFFVFADMLELGKKSLLYHREVGKKALDESVDVLLCTGTRAKLTAEEFNRCAKNGRKAFFIKDKTALSKLLMKSLQKGDAVLFKGSRGMKLEEVIKNIT